jgi:hypothetical protein
MATELGGSVFEITRDLVGDLFRAKNAGVTTAGAGVSIKPQEGTRVESELSIFSLG